MGLFDRKPKPAPEPPNAAQCSHADRYETPPTLRSRKGWVCKRCGAEGVAA